MKKMKLSDIPARKNSNHKLVEIARSLKAGEAVKTDMNSNGGKSGGNATYYNNKFAAMGLPVRLIHRAGFIYMISTLPEKP